jgi:ABC-2 type transport system permease protein
LIFFILVPLAYPLIYGMIYTGETIREVPVVVVDNSRSGLSREYLRKVDATPDIRIVSHCSDMEEAQIALKTHQAYGVIYLPVEFSDNIARGGQSKVSLYSDMSGLLYYKSLLSANTAVSLEMNKNIRISTAGNTTHRQDEITAYPIAYENISLLNPTNGFASFLIPAVLMLVIQQTLLLGIGLLRGTMRERKLFHNRNKLIPLDNLYDGTIRVVFGKGLSYFMVYAVLSVYLLCLVPRIFSLIRIGLPVDLLLFICPYLLACIFFAMTVSVFVRNREACMLIFVFTSLPLLFISGISWPGVSIPDFWKYISYLFPSTFGINGYVRINSMGATLNEVAFEYRALWLHTGIYCLTACAVYRYETGKNRG